MAERRLALSTLKATGVRYLLGAPNVSSLWLQCSWGMTVSKSQVLRRMRWRRNVTYRRFAMHGVPRQVFGRRRTSRRVEEKGREDPATQALVTAAELGRHCVFQMLLKAVSWGSGCLGMALTSSIFFGRHSLIQCLLDVGASLKANGLVRRATGG